MWAFAAAAQRFKYFVVKGPRKPKTRDVPYMRVGSLFRREVQ